MNIIDKDILTVDDGLIVHQVNMKGVMGSGLAKQIASKFPLVYGAYKEMLDKHPVQLGDIQIIPVTDTLFVINLFAQERYGNDGELYTDYNALRNAFSSIKQYSDEEKKKVYIPYKIGCGLGGGDWDIVSNIIDEHLPDAIICKK